MRINGVFAKRFNSFKIQVVRTRGLIVDKCAIRNYFHGIGVMELATFTFNFVAKSALVSMANSSLGVVA